MTIVLPIFFAAVFFGLFTKRMTRPLWAALVVWIVLIIVYAYLKMALPK